jgi:hypothetical protein
MTTENEAPKRVSTTVPLDWNEVWFTNCPMVSANNVDQELGWCREEYKKIGVEYAYFRHAPENNWYPHYIHNLDNLIRFGGLGGFRRSSQHLETEVFDGRSRAGVGNAGVARPDLVSGKAVDRAA